MELDNAWGGRLSHQYEKIIPREKRDSLSDRYVPKGVYRIPSDIAMAYRKKTIDFWMQKDLPPERILIAITSLTGPYLTAEDNKKIAELDVEALNFFLCQSDSMIYAELITHIFSKSDHHATWVIWIHNYIDQLRQHGSEINKIFRAVFDLWDKEIFVPKGSKLTSGAKKKLPDILQLALLESQKNFLEKNPPSVSDSVADILGFSPYSTSTSLKSRSHQPEKEKVNNPNKSSLFIR
jgi:hypothetical protein